MTSISPRAAIYLRVSTAEQGEHGHGLDAQRADCERLAAELGAEVVAVYEDRDSGTLWSLPGLNRLLDGAGKGEFDTVLCHDPDRLSRRMAKYVVLEQELDRAGVALRFFTARAGDTPEDRAMLRMKGVFAELDHERIVLKLARGKRIKAEKGQYVGTGVPPLGYRYLRNERGRAYALEADPMTAPVVVRIFLDLAHMSIRQVCDALTTEGAPTYRGGARWHPATIESILNNPVYLGTAAYGRRNGKKEWQPAETWIHSSVPALVDRVTWDAAHDALRRRDQLKQRRARSAETEAAYPLRGLLRCGHCGGALQTAIAKAGDHHVRYYRCLRGQPAYAHRQGIDVCPLSLIPAAPVESLAWSDVAETLLDADKLREGMAAARKRHAAATSHARRRLATLDAEVTRLRARLSRIVDEQLDVPSGSESARLLREKADQIETALNRLTAERAQLAAEPAEGLSDDEAADLTAFAAEVREGATAATVGERRIFQLIKLIGTVRKDPSGMKLSRNARKDGRFTLEWQATIQILRRDQNIVNIQTVWIGPAVAAAAPQKQAATVE